MNTPRGLLIFGFGGHARSVADVALVSGISDFCFVDTNAQNGESFLGHPVIKRWESDLPEGWFAFIAAGDNLRRQQQYELIKACGWPIATLIAPSATIGVNSKIEEGCLIAHQAHVGPMATVGVGSIINTGSIVDHESSIGDFTHVSVNATIAGRSRIGSFVIVGAGATVIDGVEVSDHVAIGAGAVVNRSLEQQGIYVGVPARRIMP